MKTATPSPEMVRVVDTETLRFVAATKLWCDLSGSVLDMRRMVVLEDPVSGQILGAMTTAAYDTMIDHCTRPFTRPVRVIDSRSL